MTYRRVRFGRIGKNEPVTFAVREIIKYLKQMDRALVLDVLEFGAYDPEIKNIIWVGLDGAFADMLPSVEDPRLDDAIAVSVKAGAGFITGTNERSVLICAYRFLQSLGCAWVRPGIGGERIPEKEIIPCALDVEIIEAADYRHRGVCIEGANTYENIADMIDYLPKIGMNEYFIQFPVPGTFFRRWYDHKYNRRFDAEPLSREEIAAMTVSLEGEIAERGICYHKTGHGWTCEPIGLDGTGWDDDREYTVTDEARAMLAEVNGKRELWENIPLCTELCYSNPEVRDRITDAITEYCKDNPHVAVLHFWLSDGANNHCECPECRKKRPSDWYVILLNELADKLRDGGLDTSIVFLIYHGLLWEPVEEKINDPDRFIMMFAPITREYDRSYGSSLDFSGEYPEFELNRVEFPKSLAQNIEHLRRWQKGFGGDSFSFDYHLMWAHIADPGYERIAEILFSDMKELEMIGLRGMNSCQVQRSNFPTALPINMMAAALWDKACDFEERANAYYTAAYGRDGMLVRNYLRSLSYNMRLYDAYAKRDFNASPRSLDYNAAYALIDEIMPTITANLERGEKITREAWKELFVHTEYARLFIRACRMCDGGDTHDAEAAVNDFFDFIKEKELELQPVLDVENTMKVLRKLWKY